MTDGDSVRLRQRDLRHPGRLPPTHMLGPPQDGPFRAHYCLRLQLVHRENDAETNLGRNILANRRKSDGGVVGVTSQRSTTGQKSGSPEEIIAAHLPLRKKKNCWVFPKVVLNPALLFGMPSKSRKKSAASGMRSWAHQLTAKCWLGPSRLDCATFGCPFADAGVEQSSSGLWRTMCRRGTLQS